MRAINPHVVLMLSLATIGASLGGAALGWIPVPVTNALIGIVMVVSSTLIHLAGKTAREAYAQALQPADAA